MTKKTKQLPTFDFRGYRTQFPVGANNDTIAITLTHDDGTHGNWLMFQFNNVPYATLPITGKEGLERLIRALQQIHDEGFDDNQSKT